jgi:di/tricarboxylate transporter
MFVLSAGLFKTGAVNYIGVVLTSIGKRNVWLALISVMVAVALMSAFINNTAAVAIFIPLVMGVAQATKSSPSKLLMPLSFAAIVGGVCTLIGTSTNILVSSIAERHGEPPFEMFEFTRLGVIFAFTGIAYMLTIGVRLIPERRAAGELIETYGMGEYLAEVVLLSDAKSVGKPLSEAPIVKDLDLEVLEVRREGERLTLPRPVLFLKAGDVLRVRCDVAKLKKLQERSGVRFRPELHLHDADLESEDMLLVEAVIAPNSQLEGRTLKRTRFRDVYAATALALRHRGKLVHENLEDIRLHSGDVLLLDVKRDHLDQLKRDSAFVLVSELGLPEFRKKKMLPAVAIIAAVVSTAALGIVPIVIAAIAGCILMVMAGCITLEEAYGAIDWKVIFLLAGVLTLGVALENTGAALLISHYMVGTLGIWGPVAMIAGFYLVTSILTELMSNNATAALMAPIALATAQTLGLSPRPFLMAVTFAASASFMTPVGYQTNTMIYGPGQYRYTDYFRVGAPLDLGLCVLATIFIPRFWPF